MRTFALLTLAAAKHRYDTLFEQFVLEFEKVYSEEERAVRKEVFAQNMDFIEARNAEDHPYKLGVTAFADLTPEEFSDYLGYRGSSKDALDAPVLGTHMADPDAAVPDSVDWRTKGAVTPVKDQGRCGSCWAFSSTGALEGAWQLATGKLVSISEQQFVDCAKYSVGNMGCSGGRQTAAFTYAEKHAMVTEDSYKYEAKSGTFKHCNADKGTTAIPDGGVTGYKLVDHSEDALKQAIAQQPVSVAIEADQMVFQHYKSGVLDGSSCGAQLDHAVLAVGYGKTMMGQTYWIVKNSWGTKWGEDGYVRIIRGKDECGILNGPPVYPVVKASSELVV